MKELEILYLDNHLIAVNKPSGMMTQPSGTKEENLEDLTKEWLKNKFKKEGAVFLHAVHRLDRVVSGIVLFARTSKALKRLNSEIKAGNWNKTYLALVSKKPKLPQDRLVDYIFHDEFRAVIVPEGKGKRSSLSYKCCGKFLGYTVLEVDLETGRYHQIRAQLSNIGSPIVGDKKYGGKEAWGSGIALMHHRLKIIHPTLKKEIVITAVSDWV